ncbi:MAG TPA: hypothetical protein VKV23_08010 [Acidimicrobiales bacterium]|nr:hypothetical protein [Acidimicrobiales bacterium]
MIADAVAHEPPRSARGRRPEHPEPPRGGAARTGGTARRSAGPGWLAAGLACLGIGPVGDEAEAASSALVELVAGLRADRVEALLGLAGAPLAGEAVALGAGLRALRRLGARSRASGGD